MIYNDLKFVNLVSHRLRNFKQKDTHYWNCSCPLCGDSKKDLRKARGYILESKNKLLYKCFNCGVSMSFGSLLKRIDSNLYNEYALENYKDSTSIKTPHAPAPLFKKEPEQEILVDAALDAVQRCDKLPITHQAVKYLISRKIPKDKWNLFYHTDTFKKYTNKLLPGKFEPVKFEHARLIIPFFTNAGKMFAYQARAYGDEEPKYFTIKLDENEEKIYGQDRVDYSKTIYVVEGPIDSLFLDNALAVSGSSFDTPTIKSLASNAVLVMDNEPRNKQIVKQFGEYIDSGYTVCIWPDNIQQKDINEMLLAGMTKAQIMETINTNTYQGLSAKLQFNQWRKC